MRIIKWTGIILLFSYVIIFSVYNKQSVEITLPFFGTSAEMPLYLFFFITIIAGVITGGIVLTISRIKYHSRLREYKKKILAMEREIESHKIDKKISNDFTVN